MLELIVVYLLTERLWLHYNKSQYYNMYEINKITKKGWGVNPLFFSIICANFVQKMYNKISDYKKL